MFKTKTLRYIFLYVPIFIFLLGCTPKNITNPVKIDTIELQTLISTNPLTHIKANSDIFLGHFYTPWSLQDFDIDKSDAMWANRVFLSGKFYAENRLLWEKSEIKSIIKQTNFQDFMQTPFYAITTSNVQVRNLPTNKPFMKNPKLDGEGFAFDYLQNTRLHINTPLFVSHTNVDGSWAFVKNPSSYGWIPVQNIYKISKKELKKWKNYPKIVITKEKMPIYDTSQNFLRYAKIGALFPLIKSEKNFYKSFVYDRLAGKIYVDIPKDFASLFPLEFTKKNIFKITKQLLQEKYGWGGFLGNRDCSALTQDYFRVFGIWIPRNSTFQSRAKNSISLKDKTPAQKEKIIQKFGIPFISLLHLKGHIMLYMGKYNAKAYVLHNLWGIHTKNDHRYFIGRAILSNLYLGEQLPNLEKNSLLINRVDNLVLYPDSLNKEEQTLLTK